MRIWDLKPGMRVRIKRAFTDFDGQVVEPGERVVATCDYFFYDEGHTLTFTDGSRLRLAGIDPSNEPVLRDDDDLYWEVVRDD